MMMDMALYPQTIELRHAHALDELRACFPVIKLLRPNLRDERDWTERVSNMRGDGYRILMAVRGSTVVGVSGYRTIENLVHGRFLYVDDHVTESSERGQGIGAAMLAELSSIGEDEFCNRLVLDTAATNKDARRYYKREGLLDAIVGFIKPLEVSL